MLLFSFFCQIKGRFYTSTVLIMDAMTRPRALTNVLQGRSRMCSAQGRLT
ncbi:hypothetical protein EXN66_Car012073 [Channa argus]|uniref:Uncharacterized protein n=1 Tax=Channa argus TaxID=215402 RepID=A0A6G1Q2H1_CHAAH|nr:hypothetical protein EXN66_Car012073 [Channa argus]